LKILDEQNILFSQSIKLNWILNTNGSLLTEEDVQFLKKHDIEIHLSIDGKENTNDLSRTFHNGKSTFSTVIKSLKLIQKYKIRAQINSYLMPTNFNSLKDIVDIAHEHDIPQIYLDQFYSDQMNYNLDTFEKFQDVYFYSLSKNINLTGPWSRVKNNFNSQKSREFEFVQSTCLDINVNGSFYSSNLPQLKYNPLPFSHLTTYLNNQYEIDKSIQLRKYQNECQGCKIFSQCLGLAKEQVWYHINENAPTSSSCDFFINWISYLELPLYIYTDDKFDTVSLFPREEIEQLINDIKNIVYELENSLWKLNQKFSLRIVRDLVELKYASKQYLLPNWVRSTTNSNTLFHLSAEPSRGLRHEITHIFLNQKNFNLNF
jgi:sulfatase maturation enzyme AslB (radical SAM superfamily)